MSKKIILTFVLLIISSIALAGYGRGGSGGSFGRSSSFSSSRSYSAPARSYSSYSAPRQTVIREYHHTNTNNSSMGGNGMGIGSTIAASAAGSMIGNALTSHGSNTASQPQVVYVNGQPQQVQQPAQVQQEIQPQVTPSNQSYTQQEYSTDDDKHKIWYALAILFIITGLFVAYKIGKEN